MKGSNQPILINKITNAINLWCQSVNDRPSIKFSEYLSTLLKYDYRYLSYLFSVVTGNTIIHSINEQRIEQAKSLLLSDGLNLTEISNRLHFSSASHLSKQFKKVTGLSPTLFRLHHENTLFENQPGDHKTDVA